MNAAATPYSYLKIFHHHEILENLLQGERCKPLCIRIKPTNRCNHNCSYCHYRNSYLDLDEYNLQDQIPEQKMMEIVQDLADMGVKAVTFSGGGEPLLYPYIEEAMEKLIAEGIDLSMITNGSLLEGKKAELLAHAKWVRISIESCSDEQYCKIRGIKSGSFEKLCNNIREFAQLKDKTCELGINVVVNNENYKEIRQIAELMKGLGVNHVKYAPVVSNNTWDYHKDFKQQVTEALEKAQSDLADETFRIIDLYSGDFSNSVIFQRQYHRCPVKEFRCVIAANSKVYYCQDKAYLSDGLVCDLKEISFKDGWYSEDVTKKFIEFDAMQNCRQHCVYDGRNQLINSFLEMDRNHVNFI